MQRMFTGAIAGALLAALAACDNGAKAPAAYTPTARAEAGPAAGRLFWAASRTRSADEAARAQFERNGAALGATSVEDYVAEAKAFVARPPKGTEMATRRNGDVLFYDPASNRFAVATAQGAPRTLFKPREGAAYWAEQKAKAGQQARAKSASADEG
jgi:pyocin large subunit-like protein